MHLLKKQPHKAQKIAAEVSRAIIAIGERKSLPPLENHGIGAASEVAETRQLHQMETHKFWMATIGHGYCGTNEGFWDIVEQGPFYQ
eukprot:TRINITY_DN640_c0_g1_i2.p2 TRINITY_DN640_c0_g1~~TRINITY_DN640_c0_g1_i2.p2  ORF type:complete len:87 (+),score=15.28 TRINITY_DN640_c0_g1_i2:423-683(+)